MTEKLNDNELELNEKVPENAKESAVSKQKPEEKPGEKRNNSKGLRAASYVAKIAMFSALSFILYLIRFPLPIFPSWLKLHFSDLAAVIAGFALGPLAGCIVAVVRVLLKLMIEGTDTVFVGEAADILIGIALVLPAALVYKDNRSKRGAVVGLIAGGLTSVAAAIIANRFMLIPAYAVTYKEFGGMNAIVGMLAKLFPKVTAESFYDYYLWLAVAPFNALRVIVITAVTFIVYKHISRLLGKF